MIFVFAFGKCIYILTSYVEFNIMNGSEIHWNDGCFLISI